MVRVVRTRLEVVDPVEDSVVTFLMVEHLTESPTAIKLYTCHMSSISSGMRVRDPPDSLSNSRWTSFIVIDPGCHVNDMKNVENQRKSSVKRVFLFHRRRSCCFADVQLIFLSGHSGRSKNFWTDFVPLLLSFTSWGSSGLLDCKAWCKNIHIICEVIEGLLTQRKIPCHRVLDLIHAVDS